VSRSLGLFKPHNSTLDSISQTPEYKILHRHAPDGGGEVAAGEVGPAQANKWHRVEIGLTLSRLVAVDWPEMSLGSGSGGSVVARPQALDLR
jgi:hypothetical protein